MGKLSKVKLALQKMLEQFSQLSTSNGLITWSGDGDYPEVGDSIMVIDEEGNEAIAENGEYKVEDGTIIVIEDGKVSEIREPENEPKEPENEPEPEPQEPENEPEPEPQPEDEPQEPENEPEPQPEDEPEDEPEDKDEKIKNLESEVARLEAENGELRERIKELEDKSAAFSASEEFERINKIQKTGIEKLDKLGRVLNAKL